MEIGIHYGISNEAYHSSPGLSKSWLDAIERSPAHCWDQYVSPNRVARERTAAMTVGSAFHALLLEPNAFAAEYILAPRFDRRTNAGKAAAAEWEAMNAGKIALDPDTWSDIHFMRDAALRNPDVVDVLTKENDILADVKTTEDASKEAFRRTLHNYRYDVQAAMYLEGAREARDQSRANDLPDGATEVSACWHDEETGLLARCRPDFWRGNPNKFVFLVFEKKRPYVCAVREIGLVSMEVGYARYRRNMEAFAECMKTGKWPGYPREEIELPGWSIAMENDGVEVEVSYA